MADVGTAKPVQTYSREAERISEQIARPNSDPMLVEKLVSAINAQANEISGFLITKAGSGRYGTKKAR